MKYFLFVFSFFLISCGTATESSTSAQNIETSITKTVETETISTALEVEENSNTESEPIVETTKDNQTKPNSKPESKSTITSQPVETATIEKPKKELTSTKISNATPSKPVVAPKVEAPKPKEVIAAPAPAPTPKIEAPVVEKPVEAPKKVNPPKVKKPQKIASLTHQAFDGILRKYVSASGNVNYSELKSNVSKLDAYLSELEKVKVNDLSGRNEKMAFWINAYNAYTLKLIVKNYPLSSITNLDGGKPWDVKWINLDGKKLSLNNIENDILRPVYKDARIHFAVNCAAKSCPPLLNKAWTAQNLEKNFQTQTKKFINDSNYNKISKKKIEVSKIFEWYGDDFGNLVNFLNKYSSTKINTDAKVNYVDYDWTLNQ